jgi:hypothetical protein
MCSGNWVPVDGGTEFTGFGVRRLTPAASLLKIGAVLEVEGSTFLRQVGILVPPHQFDLQH